MAVRQRIDRVRRDYNQWAANETLEDYALRFTAKQARRWSAAQVAQTAFGAVSFLALEAIGGSITLNYGFSNAIPAILVIGIIIFASALPICFYAAKYGVDIDLLTRGAGFGYIGSTITSLIYASFTFIFFAIESVIMAMALNLSLGIPLSIGYLVAALAVVPLVAYGITAISRFQVWTQPFFVAMNVIAIVAIVTNDPGAFTEWTSFAGAKPGAESFQLIYFGAAASVTIALIVQVGEQVDFLRFLPDHLEKRKAWWLALLWSGPGWIVPGILKLCAGSFLATYLLEHGVPASEASDPPRMYATAFQMLVGSKHAAMILMCIFVVLCQLKINVTNAYAGSIAWSNFFARLTHTHPGRVVWLIFNVVIALLVMELGVYRALEQTLSFYSSVAVAWIGAVVADLVINKPLGLSPPTIEFKRAHLYDINPVGVGSMALATAVAMAAQFGEFGTFCENFAPFLALLVALLSAPLIAVATKGRYYLARVPDPALNKAGALQCCICENTFEPEDVAECPAYAGPICSLCCSLDARCHDMCKPHARVQDQLTGGLSLILPEKLKRFVRPHLVEFLLAISLSIIVIAIMLSLIELQIGVLPGIDHAVLISTLWNVFLSLLIVVGVICWLFVLVQVSRQAAHEEMLRQTQLLMNEIEAHQKTDAALKRAKEAAESANFAKSRYVVGLSHELRTPLNTILGYGQLLERDSGLTAKSRSQIAVMRRSANHLSGLIDGLLDISKIEAGKLDLSRDEIALQPFLNQIVDMFAVQAAAKGIQFIFEPAPELPALVATDEKRLRQIIINVLSNAIKFTSVGRVRFKVSYRNLVAEFAIEDTGPGIAQKDLERIFEPFERLRASVAEPGTGLGLTICKLLSGVMGGDLRVTSEVGVGSTFRLRTFLPQISDTRQPLERRIVTGPVGAGHSVLIIDDDPVHRDIIIEVLTPLAFVVSGAPTAADGLDLADRIKPDLFLLDIELPEMDGWQLAEKLRETGHSQAKIIMLSAGAMEEYRSAITRPFHDAYIMKPVDVARLIETAVDLLGLPSECAPAPSAAETLLFDFPDGADIQELINLAKLGHITGLRATLNDIAARDPKRRPFVDHLLGFVDAIDLHSLKRALEKVSESTS